MSLQIRELRIKVTVNADEKQSAPTAQTSANEDPKNGVKDNDAIIALCVQQVMEILKEKMEP